MDLKELVNRQDSKPLSQEEAIFVIKQYIKIRKGADINPVIDMSIGFAPIISDQLIKLTKLTAIAISWLRSNKY